ncbi:preprotein translocase subunit SecE [Hydrogenophaga sp.]|uniref:preprotein translocase subunit SecE n=1 Tax=Hydrogenophaga sp. TaxID=1904254 RepID=UPI0019912EE1|nr:preprotein translocase subunit SecE [Hydrogenophaga sp.]MBD3893037.1 preprotein translocase subunit SecE [Hydrogenophaga sp.]
MATPEIETVSSGADKAKIALALAFVLGAFVAFYLLPQQDVLLRWAALLACLAAAVGVFGVSESGRRLWAFAQDAWRETKKVVWPARKEAIHMTLYVFVFVFIMALFLWLTDQLISWVFYDLILGWRE